MATDNVSVYLENKWLQQRESYLRRGRRLAPFGTEELVGRLKFLFRSWAGGAEINHTDCDDILVEFDIRGIDALKQIPDELAALKAASQARAEQLMKDPHRWRRAERNPTNSVDASLNESKVPKGRLN